MRLFFMLFIIVGCGSKGGRNNTESSIISEDDIGEVYQIGYYNELPLFYSEQTNSLYSINENEVNLIRTLDKQAVLKYVNNDILI